MLARGARGRLELYTVEYKPYMIGLDIDNRFMELHTFHRVLVSQALSLYVCRDLIIKYIYM